MTLQQVGLSFSSDSHEEVSSRIVRADCGNCQFPILRSLVQVRGIPWRTSRFPGGANDVN